MWLVDVAMPVPVARAFTYSLPEKLVERVVGGARVICPFGGRRLVGVVLEKREGEPPDGVKSVASLLDGGEPTVPGELLTFLRDLASYYLAPIGEVMRLALPPVERATSQELAQPELFGGPGAKGIGKPRVVKWVIPTEAHGVSEGHVLRGQAAAILAQVRAGGEAPLPRLEERWPNARPAVKRLLELGLVHVEEREAPRTPFARDAVDRDVPPRLTGEQTTALAEIERSLAEGRAATHLLHGVTGSGKTEVYLHSIVLARAARRGSIVLVPEIALTPQLVARFRARFGDDVAVLHSALTPRERFDMWTRLRRGEVDVAIGARSALFAPVRDLGLIIVDEEHDSSFKQEEGVRYGARDMAILRAHRVRGVCILGSATPSLESEQLTRTGKASKLRLRQRPTAQALPVVEIVDLRRIGAGPSGDKRLSLPLHREIERTLAAGEQAILFLNRRGFAPSVRCTSCGELASCLSCSVALTFHKRGSDTVRCHYCDYAGPLPERCAKCGSPDLLLEGLGTEKLEETLAAAFPGARVGRLDRDVASGRKVDAILARMRRHELDILVGTQMVTKGHDLPVVTLVGVINADAALSIPDFRAAERGFQLLVQVAGRAGRGERPGRVIVQTYDPSHPAIVHAARHDVDGFIEHELGDRHELGYPPYSRVALIRVDDPDADAARRVAGDLAAVARRTADAATLRVLGPAPAPLARLRNRYRFRVMLRAAERGPLRRALASVARHAETSVPHHTRVALDVDPVQML